MQDSLNSLDLFSLLLKKLWLLILISVLGLLMAFGYAKLLVTPQYSSTVKFYISNTPNDKDINTININDLNAAEKLVQIDIAVLQSDRVLEKVISSTSLDCTSAELRNMLTITSVNDTGLMDVKVTTNNAQLSSNVANTIAAVAPEQIIQVTKAGYVELVDEAKPDPVPSSPNVTLDCIVGALIGFLLTLVIIVVREMLDQRVKSEEDLKNHYDIPVLGTIPDLRSHLKGANKKYEYYNC